MVLLLVYQLRCREGLSKHLKPILFFLVLARNISGFGLFGTPLSTEIFLPHVLAVLRRLPTMDRMLFLGRDGTCKLWKHNEETLSHLFFACSFTSDIWNSIRDWARLRRAMSTIQSSLKWLKKECQGTSWISSVKKLCLAVPLYYSWKCRNKVDF